MPSIDLSARTAHPCLFAALAPLLAMALLRSSAAQTPALPPPAPPPPIGRPDLPPLPSVPKPPSVHPVFSVVIDAAHGGADQGARLDGHLVEKDLTLAFAIRLRSALAARGIAVTTTRESDLDLSPDTRAATANHALASACLLIHATASGSGVHLLTSSLAPAPAPSPTLVPWAVAQAGFVTRSLRLSSELNSALGQAGIPVTLGSTALRPLDNLACPAAAVEIAPLAASAAAKAALLSNTDYQQRILAALSAAILQWSIDWRQQP